MFVAPRRWLVVGLLALGVVGGFAFVERVSSAATAKVSKLPDPERQALDERVSAAPTSDPAETEIERQVDLRRQLGLNDDPDLVRRLLLSPESLGGVVSSGGDFAGLTVTEPEAEELAFRNSLQSSMHSVNEWMLRNEPAFIETSIEFDRVSVRDVATILMDRPVDDVDRSRILELVPSHLVDRIRFSVAPVSRQRLDARVDEVLTAVREHGIEAGLSVKYAQGVIVINAPSRDHFDRLVEFIGSDLLDVEIADGPSGPGANSDAARPYGLVIG